jgi:hypothetical protein
VVNSILSLFVWIVQLVERLLVFHGLSLRRLCRQQAPRISNCNDRAPRSRSLQGSAGFTRV